MGRQGRIVAALVVVLSLVAVAPAGAERAFAPRFAANAQGDVALVANSALSCITVDPSCPGIRDGSAPGNTLNNNTTLMTYVDVDSDQATFDSSEASLALPATSRVLFAGLYWGARTKAGIGGAAAPDASARGRVLLRPPGAEDYISITASQIDDAGDIYQGFADVTDAVRDAGAGDYTVANIQAGTGRNDAQLAGWSLVVAYSDPASPPRNLSVFDGLQNVSTGLTAPVTVALSGFRTPTTGTVRSRVGIVAYEGDRNTTGDGVTLQGPGGDVGLPQGAPSNNAFRSAITSDGTDDGLRNPAYNNQLGFDAHLLSTTNLLGNAQTATTVKLSTKGDAYQPGGVTIATDLFAPRITATKTVDKSSAGLGDELTYTTTIRNTGEDTATDVRFEDALPAGVTFVPGSLRIDDVAQSDLEPDGLDLRPIAAGAERKVAFRVRVAADGIATGTVIENTAAVAFTAQDLGTRDRVETAPARTAIAVPDVAIAKSHSPALVSGGTSTYTIDVTNTGDALTSGTVTVTDTLDADLAPTGPATGPGWTCSGTTTITCARDDALAAEAAYPPISIPVRVAAGTPPGDIANTATVTAAPNGNDDNNSVTDAGAVSTPRFDLAVTKETSSTPGNDPTRYTPGEEVTFAITLTNNGPDAAPRAGIVDTLPVALEDVSGTSSAGSCSVPVEHVVFCDVGTLAVGDSVQITVRGRLATSFPPYPSASTETNTVQSVFESGEDVELSNDTASSTFDTVPVTDLTVTKSFAPEHPAAGGLVTFTVTVRNNGPSVVDVVAADLIPAEIQDPAVTIAGGAIGDCRIAPFPGAPRDIPQCAIPQLEVGGERVFTITGRLAPGSAGTPVTNRAAASGQAAEQDFTNNLASVTFTPGTSDVALTKTVDKPAAAVGDIITYTLTARATGDADAQDVVVSDPLPAGLEVADPLPDGCSFAAGTVRCRAGTLAPGAAKVFAIPARVGAAAADTTAVNRATVTSDGPVATAGDDSASATVTVAAAPSGPSTPTPAPPAETPASPASPPSVSGASTTPVTVATSCASRRRFVIRVRERQGRDVVRATVTFDGHAVKTTKNADGRWIATVDLRGKAKATYRVVVRATLRGNKSLRWTRAYKTCAAKQPSSNDLDNPGAL